MDAIVRDDPDSSRVCNIGCVSWQRTNLLGKRLVPPQCQGYTWWEYCDFNCSASCWPWLCERIDMYCGGGWYCTEYHCIAHI
jgi:hypothetical protein